MTDRRISRTQQAAAREQHQRAPEQSRPQAEQANEQVPAQVLATITNPSAMPVRAPDVLALQRTMGNRSVQRLLQRQSSSQGATQPIQRLTEEERQQLLAKQQAERQQELAALGGAAPSTDQYLGSDGVGKDTRLMTLDPRFQATYEVDRASDKGSFLERTKQKIKGQASKALKNIKEKRSPTSNYVPGENYELREETTGDKLKRFGKKGASLALKQATNSIPVVGAGKKVAGAVLSHERQKVSEEVADSSQDFLTNQIASGRAAFHKQQKVDRGIQAGAAVAKDALSLVSMGTSSVVADAAITMTQRGITGVTTATRAVLKGKNIVDSQDRQARLGAQLTNFPSLQQTDPSLIDQLAALPSPQGGDHNNLNLPNVPTTLAADSAPQAEPMMYDDMYALSASKDRVDPAKAATGEASPLVTNDVPLADDEAMDAQTLLNQPSVPAQPGASSSSDSGGAPAVPEVEQQAQETGNGASGLSDKEIEARISRLKNFAKSADFDPDVALDERLEKLKEGADFEYPGELLQGRLDALKGSGAGLRDPNAPLPYMPSVPEEEPFVDDTVQAPVPGRKRSNAFSGGTPPTQVDEGNLAPEVAAWMEEASQNSNPTLSDEELTARIEGLKRPVDPDAALEARLTRLHEGTEFAGPDGFLNARLAQLREGSEQELPEELQPENLAQLPPGAEQPRMTPWEFNALKFPPVPKQNLAKVTRDQEFEDRLNNLTGGVRDPALVAAESEYEDQRRQVDIQNSNLIKLAKADPEFGKATLDHLAAPQASIGKELAINKDIQKPDTRTLSKSRTGRIIKTTMSKVVEEHNLKPSGVAKQTTFEKARLQQRERMGAAPTWSLEGDLAAKKAAKKAEESSKKAAKSSKKNKGLSVITPPVPIGAPPTSSVPAQAPKENLLKKLLKNEKERFYE